MLHQFSCLQGVWVLLSSCLLALTCVTWSFLGKRHLHHFAGRRLVGVMKPVFCLRSCSQNHCIEGDMCCPLSNTPHECARHPACEVKVDCQPRRSICWMAKNATACDSLYDTDFCK